MLGFRVFISHASESKNAARDLRTLLNDEGHRAFLDEKDLERSTSWGAQIRREFDRADIAILIVSPEFFTPGRYTLTELQWCEDRWPLAARKIIVACVGMGPSDIPPEHSWLRRIEVVPTPGNLARHVADEVMRIRARRARFVVGALVGMTVLGAGGAAALAYAGGSGGGATHPDVVIGTSTVDVGGTSTRHCLAIVHSADDAASAIAFAQSAPSFGASLEVWRTPNQKHAVVVGGLRACGEAQALRNAALALERGAFLANFEDKQGVARDYVRVWPAGAVSP